MIHSSKKNPLDQCITEIIADNTLKEFQLEALFFLINNWKTNNNPILNLDTGLGKTFLAVRLMEKIIKRDGFILIVVKASNIEDPWLKELSVLKDNYFIFHKYHKRLLLKTEKKNIIITSYDTMLSEFENFFSKTRFNYIFFDELHTVINSISKLNSLIQISKLSFDHAVSLTATLIQNNPIELILHYRLLNSPDKLPDIITYLNSSEIKKLKRKELYTHIISEFRDEFDKIFEKSVLTVSKNTAQQDSTVSIKPFIETRILLPISEMQKKLLLETSLKKNIPQTQKILSAPTLINNVHLYFSPKELAFIELIKILCFKNEKTIVYSLYTEVLYHYNKLINENFSLTAVILTGKDSLKDRIRKYNYFKMHPKINIMFASLKAFSEGINLIAANNIIFLDSWYNPEKLRQARDRCNRMHQNKIVSIYHLNIDCQEEIKILDIAKEKQNAAEQALPEIHSLDIIQKPEPLFFHIMDITNISYYISEIYYKIEYEKTLLNDNNDKFEQNKKKLIHVEDIDYQRD